MWITEWLLCDTSLKVCSLSTRGYTSGLTLGRFLESREWKAAHGEDKLKSLSIDDFAYALRAGRAHLYNKLSNESNSRAGSDVDTFDNSVCQHRSSLLWSGVGN